MKRIVIIGATSGIGLEVATLCIREGWRVGAAGRREEALEALRATAPEQVETEPLDITHDDAPGQLARLIDKLGGMDIYHAAVRTSRHQNGRSSGAAAGTAGAAGCCAAGCWDPPWAGCP